MIAGNPKYESYLDWLVSTPTPGVGPEAMVNGLPLSQALGLWDEPMMSKRVEEGHAGSGGNEGQKGEKKIYASALEAAMEVRKRKRERERFRQGPLRNTDPPLFSSRSETSCAVTLVAPPTSPSPPT